jgi:hypothetical protein
MDIVLIIQGMRMKDAKSLIILGGRVFAFFGIILTILLVRIAIQYGIATLMAAVSLLPYLLILWMSKSANSIVLSIGITLLSAIFVLVGNYVFFEAIVIQFSSLNGRMFFSVAGLELIALLPRQKSPRQDRRE